MWPKSCLSQPHEPPFLQSTAQGWCPHGTSPYFRLQCRGWGFPGHPPPTQALSQLPASTCSETDLFCFHFHYQPGLSPTPNSELSEDRTWSFLVLSLSPVPSMGPGTLWDASVTG